MIDMQKKMEASENMKKWKQEYMMLVFSGLKSFKVKNARSLTSKLFLIEEDDIDSAMRNDTV